MKKGKKAKTLIEKYRQDSKKNNLDANLDYLSRISRPVIKYNLIESAISKQRKTVDKKQKKQDEPTVFTEEDFKSFEKSYFNR